MVREIKKKTGKYYQCEECKFIYEEEKWANKCENWCKKNKSCNIEIIKHAKSLKGG